MRATTLVLCLGAFLLIWACDRGQSAADRETTAPAVEATNHNNPPTDERADRSEGTMGTDPADAVDPGASTAGQVEVEVEDLSWEDPRAIALEALGRCKGSDGARLKSVATELNRRHELVVKQGQTVCEAIFGRDSWRNQAVVAWDGEVRAVRVRGDTARVMFHEMGDDEVAVVNLSREQGRWRFDDIHSPDRRTFETWGEPVE